MFVRHPHVPFRWPLLTAGGVHGALLGALVRLTLDGDNKVVNLPGGNPGKRAKRRQLAATNGPTCPNFSLLIAMVVSPFLQFMANLYGAIMLVKLIAPWMVEARQKVDRHCTWCEDRFLESFV